LQAIIAKAAIWWASKRASNLLVALLGIAVSAGVWYVQGLRVTVAECRAAQEDMARYSQLADRYIDKLSEEREIEEENIRDAVHACLDVGVEQLLSDQAGPSEVRDGGTQD